MGQLASVAGCLLARELSRRLLARARDDVVPVVGGGELVAHWGRWSVGSRSVQSSPVQPSSISSLPTLPYLTPEPVVRSMYKMGKTYQPLLRTYPAAPPWPRTTGRGS